MSIETTSIAAHCDGSSPSKYVSRAALYDFSSPRSPCRVQCPRARRQNPDAPCAGRARQCPARAPPAPRAQRACPPARACDPLDRVVAYVFRGAVALPTVLAAAFRHILLIGLRVQPVGAEKGQRSDPRVSAEPAEKLILLEDQVARLPNDGRCRTWRSYGLVDLPRYGPTLATLSHSDLHLDEDQHGLSLELIAGDRQLRNLDQASRNFLPSNCCAGF